VNPLINLNSFTILPPWSVTCFLALFRPSGLHQLWGLGVFWGFWGFLWGGAGWKDEAYASNCSALAPSLRET
jgi:hypothetical protein